MEFMECLNEDVYKGKRRFLYIGGKGVLIATGSNLLYTRYVFYRFDDDLIEIVN